MNVGWIRFGSTFASQTASITLPRLIRFASMSTLSFFAAAFAWS